MPARRDLLVINDKDYGWQFGSDYKSPAPREGGCPGSGIGVQILEIPYHSTQKVQNCLGYRVLPLLYRQPTRFSIRCLHRGARTSRCWRFRAGSPLPARILIVDDHAVIRKTIQSILLPHSHSFQVCEEATDGKEGVEQVQKLNPEIVLLDINMPVMDGIKAAQEIRRISPETKIVFLTMFDTPVIMQATRMLSDAFVSKYRAGTELIPTLNRLIQEHTPQPEAQ